MLMEMVNDCREIVDNVTHDHIDAIVDLLKQDKNYRYLDILCRFCVCEGTPVLDNQKYITHVISEEVVRTYMI